MFTYRDLLARKYRDEAGSEGSDDSGASTEGAATETAATEGAATDTVLTGDDTNSDAGADASGDDTGASDEDGDSDTGSEGSDKPTDTYADFTLPEGIELDTAALEKAVPVFKELGLTQEQSQKLIDLQSEMVQAGSQKQVDDFNQLMNDWRDQTKNDGEFGGDKFDENVKVARAAITKYGTPELKQLLEEQGVGNRPEVIRFMVRVGQTLKEDVPGLSGSASAPTTDRVDVLYPNSKKK